jgi:predicted lipoprotein
VLFDPNIDLGDSAVQQRYCPLLIAIGNHQQALSSDVLARWKDEDGMQARLRSFPNDRYADAQEAVSDLLRTQVSAIDGLKKKLGAPLGRQSKGVPQPYQAEAWRSGASLAILAAAVDSAERLWQGANQDGLRSLLNSEHSELATRIDAAYADARQRLGALDQPLGQLLADEAGRTALNALYDSLNRLHRLQEGELARALGIQIGFNAHDGD